MNVLETVRSAIKFADENGDGVWRTINGSPVFIKEGQSVKEAVAAKFGSLKTKYPTYNKRPGVKIIKMEGLIPSGRSQDLPIGIAKYDAIIKSGKKIDPITVHKNVIIDGSHRYYAAKKNGYTEIAMVPQPKRYQLK